MMRHRTTLVCVLAAAALSLAAQQQPAHDMSNMPGMQMPGMQMPATTPAQAADPVASMSGRAPMTLAQFEDLALRNNPTLQQATRVVERSAGQARQAGLLPNPVVGYQGEQIRGGIQDGGEQGGFIQQTIPLGGKLGLRREVFEQQRRADEIGASKQRYRVLGGVDQAFYSALAAQETVTVRRNLLGLTQDALTTARQLANVGQADAPDVLQSEVEAEQAQVEYETAEYDYVQTFQSLAAIAGQRDLPLARLTGDLETLPVIDTAHVMDTILRDSPAIKRAQQDVTRAETALKSARREVAPDLQLRAGLEQNFEPLGESGPLHAVGAQGFVTAGITIPIFNRNQGNIEAAKADLERMRAEVSRTQLSLFQSAQPVIQTFISDRMRAQSYKDQVIPRAERAYQLYLTRYRQMASAYPQVIVSQRTLLSLRVGYIQSLRSAWMDAISLRNYLLSGGLDPASASGSASTSINLPGAGGSPE
jgi:cobalt-zinc-cadmium efflux system outer membrane protein